MTGGLVGAGGDETNLPYVSQNISDSLAPSPYILSRNISSLNTPNNNAILNNNQ